MTPPAVVGAPAAWPCTGAFGWVDTRLAMERICPVFTSMTMAVPLSDCDDSMAWARACSDLVLQLRYRGSARVPVPALLADPVGHRGLRAAPRPEGDSMIVSLPAVPASSWLSPYSMPAAPAPMPLVKPSTGEARFPLVTTRLESATSVMPGNGVGRDLLPVALRQLRGQHHVAGMPVQLGRQGGRRDCRAVATAPRPSSPGGRPGSRRRSRRRWAPREPGVTRRGRRCRRAARPG